MPKPLLSLQDVDILYAEQGPLSGHILGEKYLLGELIGEGGFSYVYKAQHLQVQRQQAVKVLLERHFRKPEFRDRFLREAQTVASLDHPNIIHLDDFWIEASQAYLVMPYISGGTLQAILEKQQGFLEQDQIVSYLEHICAALDYAHKRGIAHLDLKPLNLLVCEDGRLLLSDFGLAHLMKDGAIAGGSSLRVGTPHYMAPEHIRGSPERRSDLFSLGVILYQMLLGRLPFDGLPHEAIMLNNMTEWPPAPRSLRLELPQEVEDVVGKALAKQPELRYQTASDFLSAFKKALIAPAQTQILASQMPMILCCPACMATAPMGTPNCPTCRVSLAAVVPIPAVASIPRQIPSTRAAQPISQSGFVRLEEGKEPGRVYEIHEEPFSIGRSRESNIFLEDLAVSRLHASILSQGIGNYALRDEGSANGTVLNGKRIDKYRPYPLQDEDRIQVGQTVWYSPTNW